jgi:crotonobetainyl-CoA:carnitine CoA-transferase CaiB-like acyl-CoA transferase
MESALSGIKVVEVSTWFAGPTCGMWLGEHGADVVRAEPIEGDPLRGILSSGVLPAELANTHNWMWEMANRSKRCIALDLKLEESQRIMHRMIKGADVFLANLRPPTLKRAKLDYETLNQINPRLVYCNITGYGSKGPGANWPAFDETAFWTRSGIMSTMGEPGTPPVPLRGAMGDNTTGMFALGGIALALFARERTGKGQLVELSLYGNGVWVAGIDIQGALVYKMEMGRQSRLTQGNPLYNTYEAQGGKYFMFQMLETDRFWSGVCKAVDKPEWEARYPTHVDRCQDSAVIIRELDALFAQQPREYWGPRFDDNGLIWAPALTPTEVIKDPVAVENEYIIEYDHFNYGKLKGIRCPIQLKGTPERTPFGAPEFGQHTEEVLLEMGYTWEEIGQFKEKKVIL